MIWLLRTGMGLFQHRHGQDKDDGAHCGHGPEKTLPRKFKHNQVANNRCQHRDDAGNAVQHRQHFSAALGAQGIAQNGKGHHVTAACANALDKTA